jgi:integrase
MTSRKDLAGGEAKIEKYLTHLAVEGNVSPSTQNQAMNALVFLYKKVLQQPLDGRIDAVRTRKKQNIPVVLTRKAAREWQWQYVFPSGKLSKDPQSGYTRRHHIDPSVINKAIKSAAKRAGIQKRISSHTFRHSSFHHHYLHPCPGAGCSRRGKSSG